MWTESIYVKKKSISKKEKKWRRKRVRLTEGLFKKIRKLSDAEEELLFDPQTSGGLLLSVPSSEADRLITELKRTGVEVIAWVGEVVTSIQPCVWVV